MKKQRGPFQVKAFMRTPKGGTIQWSGKERSGCMDVDDETGALVLVLLSSHAHRSRREMRAIRALLDVIYPKWRENKRGGW